MDGTDIGMCQSNELPCVICFSRAPRIRFVGHRPKQMHSHHLKISLSHFVDSIKSGVSSAGTSPRLLKRNLKRPSLGRNGCVCLWGTRKTLVVLLVFLQMKNDTPTDPTNPMFHGASGRDPIFRRRPSQLRLGGCRATSRPSCRSYPGRTPRRELRVGATNLENSWPKQMFKAPCPIILCWRATPAFYSKMVSTTLKPPGPRYSR